MEIVKINDNDLQVKTWNGKRVVTLADVDRVHERSEGTARKRFNDNKNHLVENEDYFKLKKSDALTSEKRTLDFDIPNRGLTVLTESGYLLLVKSFTDDLAWQVQRDLVNSYFKFKDVVNDFNTSYPIDTNALNDFLMNLPCIFAQFNNMESNSEKQLEMLESVVDNMTLSTRQQEKIHEAARKRVNLLLGGAHSKEYKRYARSYMINLWNGLKATFHCGSSYKDLNPKDFEKAVDYVQCWEYQE